MPENTPGTRRDIGRYVNDRLRDRYFAACDVLYAKGAPVRSETDVETELRDDSRLPVRPRGPGGRVPHAGRPDPRLGRLLRDVVPQHGCAQRRSPRLRP